MRIKKELLLVSLTPPSSSPSHCNCILSGVPRAPPRTLRAAEKARRGKNGDSGDCDDHVSTILMRYEREYHYNL